MMKVKILFILAFVSLFVLKLKAQDTRWMYLNRSNDGAILLVDTLADDRQQLAIYQDRENIVLVWTNMYEKVHSKNGSYIKKLIMRIAIDTANKQYQIKSSAQYHGEKIIKSNNYEFGEWTDAIPGSIGEDIVRYVKSLNNQGLKNDLIITATLNHNPYSSVNKKRRQ
jgi:hypothetical protein